MKKRLLFIFCLTFGLGGFVFAQTKTVTNADLEGFRQKRLRAEKDYQENYQRLGLPSPQQLAERNKQNLKDLVELSERLRAERLENERIDALEAQADAVEAQNNYLQSLSTAAPSVVEQNYYYGYSPSVYRGGGFYYPYQYGWGNYDNRRRSYNNWRRNHYRRNYWRNVMPPIRPPKPIRPSFYIPNYKPNFPSRNWRRR